MSAAPDSLAGARVLVVGGSSGIGAATARQAAERGADVTIASRSLEKLASATAQCAFRLSLLPMDVTDEAAVRDSLASAGRWDHVVVTAGGTAVPGSTRILPMEVARDNLEAKFWGAYQVAAFANLAERGSLTFVSGVYAVRPAPGRTLSTVATAALEALTRALAFEFAPQRVNCVSPGVVATPMWDRLPEAERVRRFEAEAAALPARRIGEADDIAALILACATNPFLTGAVILADGGAVLQ
jgi:NAD(P)-dependent dehydrogenase (short-subunit alcohol dehydrogenase family)